MTSMGNSRFGIKEYADPTLLDTSRQSSRTAGFSEILEDWKHQYFEGDKLEAEYWEGTAYQLHKQFFNDPAAQPAIRHLTPDAIGRHLASLKQKGTYGIDSVSCGDTRKWRDSS